MKAKYDGGNKKVPNPNPDTKDRYPQVAFSTAISDEKFYQKALKEYHDWEEESAWDDEGGKGGKGDEDVDSGWDDVPEPPKAAKKHLHGVTDKDIDEALHKHKAKFESLVTKAKKEVEDYDQKYDEDEYKSEFAKKTYKALSHEEKLIHVMGHDVGDYFEQHVLQSKKLHDDYMKDWRQSSASTKAHEMNGLLAEMGVKGNRAPGESDNEWVDESRKEGANNEEMKKYAKELYTFQQAFFKHLGLKELTLFRGVQGQGLENTPPDVGDEVEVATRETSSFTLDPRISEDFGRVLKFKVPVEAVFASALVRPEIGSETSVSRGKKASMGESEVVVMGASDMAGEILTSTAKTAAEKKKPFKVHFDEKNEDWLKSKGKKDKDDDKGKKDKDDKKAARVVERFVSGGLAGVVVRPEKPIPVGRRLVGLRW